MKEVLAQLPLLVAFVCLIIGGIIFFANTRMKQDHINSTLVLAWLLISIIPVLIIYFLFPDNKASGTFLGFKFSGAIAAFIFIWWFAVSRSVNANKIETLEKQNAELNKKLTTSNIVQSSTTNVTTITTSEQYVFVFKKLKNKKIGITTGAINNINFADVWVNSENTNMQMSRYFDISISGNIRYLGAKKDNAGNVIDDTIADLLKEEIGLNTFVQGGTVLVTASGELFRSNKVKKIFHTASVNGNIGSGYKLIANVADCVKNAMCKMDEIDDKLSSIVFPLIGTGTAKDDINRVAPILINTAISYYESNPISKIKEVYFIAYTQQQLEVCLDLLKNNNKVSYVE